MAEIDNLKKSFIVKDLKQIINPQIYKFLFILLKSIFLKKDENSEKSKKADDQLNIWINQINQKLVKNNQINKEYTKENLLNILKFVKTQNKIYASEILENILIIIFSYGFKNRKENTFGKYIYNNIQKIKDPRNEDFMNWFVPEKFNQAKFKDITSINDLKKLIKNDIYIEPNIKNKLNEFQKNNALYNLLLELYFEQYFNLKIKKRKKFLSYIYSERIDFLEKKKIQIEDKSTQIGLTKSFFISIYIYYQNKHSPLMKYINKSNDENPNKKDLVIIPFEYDLTGAVIESQFAGIILAPTRIEPRISEIIMVQNILKKKGFAEISKAILFNKNIKIIDFHQSAVKSSHLKPLIDTLGLFYNYTVEEINVSYNYLKDDCEETLANIISHFKGLKTLNLSSNDLKEGISPFLITLSKLYRQKKTNLENLIINKCLLDDVSFYELGELLKSKYCKLKKLYLNMNYIPSNLNFLKKLKRNRSLTEIFLNKSNIGNSDSKNISRIISNSNVEYLYLYKNKFTDFENCLRLLYRTRLNVAKQEKKENIDNILRGVSSLYNLDLSNNDYFFKNIKEIELLQKIVEETTVYCLDLSHILYGMDPNRIINSKEKTEYQNCVLEFKKYLDEKKKEFIKIIEDIHSHDSAYEKIKKFENDYYNKIEKEVLEIINDDQSKYPVFIRDEAKKLIKEKRDFFDKEKKLNKKDLKEIENNLVEYLILKKTLKNLMEFEEKKKQKKLILI